MRFHRGHLVSVVIVAVVAAAAGLLYPRVRPPAPPPTGPQAWAVSDLPKRVWQTGDTGRRVRVGFQFPLTPTADPLVFHYHPGHPPAVAPATYRIHFAAPPRLPRRPPVVVEGTVEQVEPDLVRRANGVPGVLVLRGAVPIFP